MAVIKKNILGDISGQLGEFIYRVRNGKLVQYRRPVKQRISRSKAAVSARNDFAMTVKFAIFINSFPALKQIWKYAKVPSSNHYQKIIKNNSAAVKLYGISAKNIITPPGIGLTVNELSVTNLGISFNVPINSFALTKLFSRQTIIHVVFYFYNSSKISVPAYSFSSIVAKIPVYQASILNIRLPLNDELRKYVKLYMKAIVFISASSLDGGTNKIYWTSTFAEEFETSTI